MRNHGGTTCQVLDRLKNLRRIGSANCSWTTRSPTSWVSTAKRVLLVKGTSGIANAAHASTRASGGPTSQLHDGTDALDFGELPNEARAPSWS
ncbi:hypothetical protein [Actinomadura madurae]|uniref:hypothetical protein n=1 Tax=Actinomadura madurae TaxID=1993 RepID=UPI0020D20A57|nr:hypothetical protein [Actinomadura madurae]MCQ0003469.1 hypothetical protein [Actinomadura madurae]MCQ0021171.1 hypothetical protein [Actinomadura madurae]